MKKFNVNQAKRRMQCLKMVLLAGVVLGMIQTGFGQIKELTAEAKDAQLTQKVSLFKNVLENFPKPDAYPCLSAYRDKANQIYVSLTQIKDTCMQVCDKYVDFSAIRRCR